MADNTAITPGSATDYVHMNVYQSSGGNLNVTVEVPPYLSLTYVGP